MNVGKSVVIKMKLGTYQKDIIDHLNENNGKAAIVFGNKICPKFRFSCESDYERSIERLLNRNIIKRCELHFVYELVK